MIFFLHYIKRLSFLLLIYTSSRIYFYLNNTDSFNNISIIEFIEGFRFDISALVYINIPLLVLLLIPTNIRKRNSFIKFTNIIFYIINIPFIILNNIDIEYFRFTQKRSTIYFFQFLQLGEDARILIPQYLKNYWPITLFTIIQIWFLLKIKDIQKETIKFKTKSILKSIFFLMIGVGIFILGARGGIQLKPIKPINAGELSGSKNSSLILNTPFCILHSLRNKQLKKQIYFNQEEIESIYSPLHNNADSAINKKNIIIFIMESFSKEFVGFYNNGIGYTPFLDSLMQHSLVFTNAYANGLKSIEALPAITASIPTLMDNPFITSNYAQNNFKSMASLLNNEGYETSFYHGGKRGTMGFYSFSKKAGFTSYFGMEEYNNTDDFDGSWGIYDGPFIQYFADNINHEKEPFFSTFFSLSSHPPYVLPENYYKEIDTISKLEKIGIRETISYTDHCMRYFFEESKNKEWFKNTVFIITADHTSGVNYIKKYKNKIGRYGIPLILYGNNSLKGINKNIVQQVDIMPTVLKMINYRKPYFAFGKSMFEKSWAINYNQNEYRLITDSSIIINKEENYISYSDLELLNRNKIDNDYKQLLKAIKQDYNNRMLKNKLFYENKVHY